MAAQHTYTFSNTLRFVVPYEYTFKTFVKRRWEYRSLLDVLDSEFRAFDRKYFEKAIAQGKITVGNAAVKNADTLLKPNQLITHNVTLFEPPVPRQKIVILAPLRAPKGSWCVNNIVAVVKPCGIPVHKGAIYIRNTLASILTLAEDSKELVFRRSPPTIADPFLSQVQDSIENATRRVFELLKREGIQQGQENNDEGLIDPATPPWEVVLKNDCTSAEERLKRWVGLKPLHRLDRMTSGIVLLTYSKETFKTVSEAFSNGVVHKSYVARVLRDFRKVCCDQRINEKYLCCICEGTMICKDRHNSQYAFLTESSSQEGKYAKTVFVFLKYNEESDESLILCLPKTGRTHQLRWDVMNAVIFFPPCRAQLQTLGHPITNDPCYTESGELKHEDWIPQTPHVTMGIEEKELCYHPSGIFLHAWRYELDNVFAYEDNQLPDWCHSWDKV